MFNQRKVTQSEIDAMSDQKREQHEAFSRCLLDLRFPVGPPSTDAPGGTVADVSYIASLVAYHLIRCGWRPEFDKRVIKSRKPVGRGIATGAVEWVGIDEPDDELDGLANMTMREISELSPAAKFEAIRRLGGDTPNDLPKPDSGWKVKPNINIVDVPQNPFVES